MIIWRGMGFLVAIIGIAIGVLAYGGAAFVANQFYPGDPYATDLFEVFNPQLFSLFWLGAGIIGAPALWFLGKKVNEHGNVHTLFFIPFQWWGPIVAAVAIGGSGYMFFTDGVKRANISFVQSCADHEKDANAAICGCLAAKIEKGADPHVFIPFYAEAKDAWRSRTRTNDDVLQNFATKYMSHMTPEQSQHFIDAFDAGVKCFDNPSI